MIIKLLLLNDMNMTYEHCAIKFNLSYKGCYIFEGQGANELNLNMPQ